jgi:hypothetical protein
VTRASSAVGFAPRALTVLAIVVALFVALFVAIGALAARPAAADDAPTASTYRSVVDRVDLEPSTLASLARLRVYLNALALDGQGLDLTDPKTIKVVLGSSELKAPNALGRYGATDGDTVVVFVIQANLEYAEAMPTLIDALDKTVLDDLPERYQVAVVPFGEAIGSAKLGTVKAARAKLASLTQDGSAGEPALLDTVERALVLMKRATNDAGGRPLRKVIVLISDGRDRGAEKDRVIKLGKRAAKDGVRIDALGFSPPNLRRPLLLLGELSKQSLGTFRWVRTPATVDTWTTQLKHLREELQQQYVLTYFVPAADVAGKKLKVVTVGRTATTSNEVKVPDLSCAGEACEVGYCAAGACVVPAPPKGRGFLGWIVLLIGGAVVVIVGLGAVGFALSRRKKIVAPPGFEPGAKAPGALAGGAVPGGATAVPAGPPPGTGAFVPAPAAPAAPVFAAPVVANRPGVAQPCLYVINGPRAGQRLPLRHGFAIGKAPGCDLQIEDGFTSSHHAQITMDGWGNCVLYDRGSTNGTFVNGVRITESPLTHGVSVKIGSTELRYLAE